MKLNKNKWFMITGTVIALLLVTPLIIVQVYKDEIKQEIEKQIDANVNAVVTFEKLDYSFFFQFPHLTLGMKSVDVVGINEFEGDTLAHVERVDLKVDWIKIIFFNKIKVDRVVLNKPKLHMHVLHDGNANYDIFKSDTVTNSDEGFASISLDGFSIREGTIQYWDQQASRWFELHDLDHDGAIKITGNKIEYLTATTIEHVSVTDRNMYYMRDKKLVLKMDLEYDMGTNICSIKENNIQLNKLDFGFDGTIAFLDAGYDINVTVASKETSFSDILSLVPSAYTDEFKKVKTEGLLSCSGLIKGKYFDTSDVLPAFHLDFKIADAMLQVPEFPSKIKDIQFDLVVDNNSGIMDSTIFDLKRFNMDFGGHPVKGRCRLQGFSEMHIDTDILAELDFETIEKIFPIDHFDVKGKLNLELKANGIYKKKNVQEHVEVTSIPAFTLNLQVADGTLKYDSAAATFHDIHLTLNSSNTDGNPQHTDFDLKNFQMSLGKNNVSGNVLMKGLNPCFIRSDLKASMDLADVEKLYPRTKNELRGLFETAVVIDGTYDTKNNLFPSINALINLTDGYLKTPGYPEPIENIHFTAHALNKSGKAEDTRVDFDQLTFLMEGNLFSLKGYIEDFIKMNYDFSINGILDLEKLTKVFPIEGVQLQGIVNADIESKGSILDIENGDYSKIACAGNVVLKAFKYRTPAISRSLHLNEAQLKLTPTKIVMTKCDGRIGRTKFSVTGDLMNYMYFITANNDMITGDLKLISDTLDLTPWIDKTYARQRAARNPAEAAALPVDSKVWEVPKNVNFIFDSEIANVYYQDLHITKLKGEITIKNGVLTLNETGFNSLNAFFSVTGNYNTTDIRHPLFDVHLDVKELDINKAYNEIALVRKLAPAAGDTYGRVSINYKLAGELDQKGMIKLPSLKGGGDVTIADAKINGMKMFDEISKSAKQEMKNPDLKNFSMDSYITDNRLYIKPFSLKVNGLNTDVVGSNDITGGNLDYLIRIELIPIDKMKIPFHVTGTYDDPKVAMGKGKASGQ